MAIETGGAAFPHVIPDEGKLFLYVSGMTLRDYFAAAALMGLCARDARIDELARLAYAYADDMLKAREPQERK